MSQIADFFRGLFSTNSWPARWECGAWSDFHGWLYIISDLLIWISYFAIPLILFYFIRKREVPFKKVFILFILFILLCGTTHLVDAIMFWHPLYRFSALVRLLTALASLTTVVVLIRSMRGLMTVRSNMELEKELEIRSEYEEKLSKLAEIVESSGDAIISTDLQGRITSWNHAAEEFFEYKEQEIIGKNIFLLFTEENKAASEQLETEARRGRYISHVDTEILTKYGTKVYMSASLSPIFNARGRITGVSSIYRDISDRKMAEEQARQNQVLFKSMSDASPLGVYMTGVHGDCIYINQVYQDITGLTPEKSFGKAWFSAIYDEDREQVLKTWNESVEKGGLFEMEYRFKHESGQAIWVNAKAAPMYNSNKQVIGFIGTLEDISERVITQQKLKDSYSNLEKAANELMRRNKQLEDFARITSHNLRSHATNLTSLLYLHKEHPDDDKETVFAMIDKAVLNLNETLHDMMEVVQINTEVNKEREKLVFEQVMNRILETVQAQILENNVAVYVDFSKAKEIEYPKTYLESILLNLLTNAIKYRSPERDPVIHIKTERSGSSIILTVSDNGLGLDMKRFGSRLFGLRNTFHSHPDAKGVGLFLIKSQIEAMGGAISVTSEVNKGATFTVNFTV